MRVGVVGLGMGLFLATWCRRLGMEVVAACDRDPVRRAEARALLPDARLVDEWPALLEERLDAVVLANDFDEHAPLAIAFLDAGVHVLSESAACTDEQQARALLAAERRSAATYSFAENYVFHPHIQLVRTIVAAGAIGRVNLIEADYLHGMAPDAVASLIGDPAHWRGRIEPTAYCTHTLSPVLALTGALPTEVAAFAIDSADPRAAVVMVVRLDDGGLAITRHGFLQGEPDSHWSWFSARGSKGLAESVRAPGERAWSVRVRKESWTDPGGNVRDEEREPAPLILPDGTPVESKAEGTVRILEGLRACVEDGRPPLVPVLPAVAASLAGVAGARSLRENSRPIPMPDLVAGAAGRAP
ncbi:Gfo/Idh/MocA family oxidoreductase [Nocardia flavorosea]|uniref:Gfo/Idh/MocA family oxidoreductase n=2 Tax=Nocardia flavorosea TaxID=53429 RepID=A0A846YLT8_9NOCA|nr:Gfo/Idh/MocA family oxidoreductase [Nocardia flavorosea]